MGVSFFFPIPTSYGFFWIITKTWVFSTGSVKTRQMNVVISQLTLGLIAILYARRNNTNALKAGQEICFRNYLIQI